MDNSIQLVVFDIAGTTVEDNGEITAAFQSALSDYGYDVPSEKISDLMGYNKPHAIKMMLEEFEHDNSIITSEFINTIHDRFKRRMIEHYTSCSIQALPHAENIFIYLKEQKIKIGLDTGFSNDITEIILERLGWLKNDLVDFVVSSNEVPAGRPYPYMIRKMMRQSNIDDPQRVVKIGDTEVDIQEGKRAGCLYTIAVTTGAFTREQLESCKPSFIIDDLQQVIPILNRNAQEVFK